MDWSVADPTRLAIALEDGTVWAWDLSRGRGGTTTKLFHRSRDRKKITKAGPGGKALGPRLAVRVLRWNPREPSQLAAGHDDGSLTIYDTEYGKITEKLIPPEGASKDAGKGGGASLRGVDVTDVQWDALSNGVYCLAAYKNGAIALWDSERGALIHEFDRAGGGIRALQWMEWEPGNFCTVTSRTGVVRVWNVSQKAPLRVHRVGHGSVGFHYLQIVPGQERCVFSLSDGSVGVYHLGKAQLEWRGPPGHKETIFDVRFNPRDPDLLATASYDSTVKLWRTATMECVDTLRGQSGVIYAVSWSPDGTRLVAGSSRAELFVWDVACHAPAGGGGGRGGGGARGAS